MIARSYTTIGLLALLAPLAAMADITDKNVSVAVGQQLNLETGAAVASGGDLSWNGTFLTPLNGSAVTVGGATDSDYQALTQATLQQFKSFGSFVPGLQLALSSLTGAVVIMGFDSAGHVYKGEVLNTQGTQNQTLQLKITVYGASSSGGGPVTPAVTKILNNYSLIPKGFVNSGVAPSTIVAIFGSNLADPPPASGLTLNNTASPGIPTTSAGASATIAAGGKSYPMPLYYASPTQMAGVIPAAVPPGAATLTVTYKSQTSSPFSFTVVANALGLGTYGPGTIIATGTDSNNAGQLVDYTHAALPGHTYVFWGSGGGSDPADSDSVLTGTPHSVNQSATQFYFGSTQGTVLYSGSSGYPGLMQMNVTIPSNVATGCSVSVVGIVNGIPSNFGPLPIDGSGICHDSIFGISGTDITGITGGTVKTGTVFLGSLTAPAPVGTTTFASASFASQSGATFSGGGVTTIGSCSVLESDTATGTTVSSTVLNPGTVTVTGPGVSATLQSLAGLLFAQLSGGITAGGTYTFSNGGGGPDVGAFNASLTMPNPLLTWTNSASLATVTRSGGIQVNWTGGAAGSYVQIMGTSTTADGSTSGSFTCYAPQSAGTFQVPSFVVNLLPAGKGSLTLENSTLPQRFTAPKIDQAFAFGFTGTQINTTFN